MPPPYAGLPPRILSPVQVDTFIRSGWLVIADLIPAPLVAKIRPLIEARLAAVTDLAELRSKPWAGYLLKDSPVGPPTDQVVNPRYRTIIDDLCGAGRTQLWGEGLGYMPIRFPEAGTTWSAKELHVDGIHFHHHVDSREQGLIAVELWTDIAPQGGGTALVEGSHHLISRLLAAAEPEGLDCASLGAQARAAASHLPVIETHGRAGSVLFMHPHLLHGSSTNLSQQVRIAGNHCVTLREPMDLSRPADQLSPVEWSIVHALRPSA